jgi:tetratricopeptide (TPR) repeat protein
VRKWWQATPHTQIKTSSFIVLDRAGYYASGHLRAEWLERAIQLMTKELPPTMVDPGFRSIIYNNYGIDLRQLKQHANAIEAYHAAISISRTLVYKNPAKYNRYVAQIRMNIGVSHNDLGKYDDAIVAYKEALEICTPISAQDPLRYNELMERILLNYGIALGKLYQVSEAAAAEKQAISLFRNLAQTGNECRRLLCDALHNYGNSCNSLGQHTEAVLAYQESIFLQRTFASTDSEKKSLRTSLHDITYSLRALSRYAEANNAAIEALERNHGRVFEDCDYAPDFESCFLCQRAMITHSLGDGFPSLPFL